MLVCHGKGATEILASRGGARTRLNPSPPALFHCEAVAGAGASTSPSLSRRGPIETGLQARRTGLEKRRANLDPRLDQIEVDKRTLL